MVIYADVLVILNTAIDFLILSLNGKINNVHTKTYRMILGAVFSGSASVIIFFDLKPPLIALLNIITVAVTVIIAFGFKRIKQFLKNIIVILLIDCLFYGIMEFVFYVIKPHGMAVNNGRVYFNISPLELLITTGIAYLLIITVRKIFKLKNDKCVRCSVRIGLNSKVFEFSAIVDNGNALKDIYTGKDVIIVDKKYSDVFLSKEKHILLPYKTINSDGLIKGVYCDFAEINGKNIGKSVVAVADIQFDGDYGAIISADTYEKAR